MIRVKADSDSAQVKIPPPLALGVCALASWIVHLLYPMPMYLDRATVNYIGFSMLLGGLSLIIYCALAFKKAKTAIEPWKTSSALIQKGPYRFSRNPIYLGLCLIQGSLIFFLNSDIPVFFLVILILILDRYVIQKEEAYLLQKFKAQYKQYQLEVNRWITL